VSPATIRAVTPSDFNEWRRLWGGYLEFYRTTLSDQTIQITWGRLLDSAEPMWAALAVADGAPVGLVHYIEHRSCWTAGNYMYLQDLFVDGAVRSRGIGRALIEHVYAEAAARACSRVWWLTHETNTTAASLYEQVAERSGFVQYRHLLPLQ
jgi:GNAT superfamily N-acetyltransferase